jgi:large repetitive protein
MTNRVDNFNRADGALGTPSDGGSAWVAQAGTWAVLGNQARVSTSVAGQSVVLQSSSSNVTVQATLGVSSGFGLCTRAADANNYILADTTLTQARIRTRVAGVETVVAGPVGYVPTPGDVIKLKADANDLISLLINDVVVLSTTVTTGNTNTLHGLQATGGMTAQRWDDFSITDLPLAPDAPTIGTATAGDEQATVAFTPPGFDGGSPITLYTATSTPDGLTGTGSVSPITVSGLTNGTSYTFVVKATNIVGDSPNSAASNSVTPSAASASGGAWPSQVQKWPVDGQTFT